MPSDEEPEESEAEEPADAESVEAVAEIIRATSISEDPETVAALVQVVAERSWSGPLPAPEALDGYERIVPGAADRIITMAEKEQADRHEMGNGDQLVTKRGQWLAAAICVVFASVGLIGILKGNSIVGIAAMILPLRLATALLKRSSWSRT